MVKTNFIVSGWMVSSQRPGFAGLTSGGRGEAPRYARGIYRHSLGAAEGAGGTPCWTSKAS